MRVKAILVGQAPSREGDDPLRGRAGERLASVAGLDGYEELTACFTVTNLLSSWPGKKGPKGDAFPRAEARAAALRLHELLGEESWDRVVVLGQLAAGALGLAGAPCLRWLAPTTGIEPPTNPATIWRPLTRAEHYLDGEWLVPAWAQSHVWPDARWAVFPHPSGISRFWNDATATARAGRFLRSLADEVAPVDARLAAV